MMVIANYNDDDPEPLSEEQLRSLSRKIKTLVPAGSRNEVDENEIKNLQDSFEDVFHASFRPGLPATHRVAAWNVLCGLIDQCLISGCDQFQSFIWHRHIWARAFGLYLSQSHDARPKSSKHLLATLGSALRKAPDHAKLTKDVSNRLISGITSQDEPGQTKSSLQALTFFLGRAVFSLDTLLDALVGDVSDHIPDGVVLALNDLISILLSCVNLGDFGSTVGQLLTIVLGHAAPIPSECEHEFLPVWLQPLENAVRSDDVRFDEFKYHVLPVLFKQSMSDYVTFLDRCGLQELIHGTRIDALDTIFERHASTKLLLDSLVVGKELGLLHETESTRMYITNTSVLLPVCCIEQLIYLSDGDARLAGLSLLITSRSATKPFSLKTFQILKRRLPIFFADTDANFRGEVFSLIQKLMDRLRAATAVLARQSKTDHGSSVALSEHKGFLKWLIRTLTWELRPTASYQRHISALRALLLVVKSGLDGAVTTVSLSKSATNETKWPFSISIMTYDVRRQLSELLMDPFDDVRQTSVSILAIYAASYTSEERATVSEELREFIDKAERIMLNTGRADHADGVAHSYHLLFCLSCEMSNTSGPYRSHRHTIVTQLVESLQQMLTTAQRSLAVAASKYPIHGLLISIRRTVSQDPHAYRPDGILSRLLDCLNQVWTIVKPVLCNDAPEGHVPEDLEDVNEMTTKDILSYCWRALKESSLLLGALINSQILNAEEVMGLGNLSFTQLEELRHRGAFSTVAQTWITCCVRCKDLQTSGTNVLQWWYGKVMCSVQSNSTINTRRSAGLPSLICGLLIADRTGESTSRAIQDLTDIARGPLQHGSAKGSSLPQVHALNCIKDILKNARLSEHSERFISHAFLLAADSLRSEAWAVRNCGLMLFRAAIDRLLGTSEAHFDEQNRTQSKISLSKQPGILDAIFDLLRPPQHVSSEATSGNEGVFPALQLLQSVQIPESRGDEARTKVSRLTSSRSWHVRDKATRAFAAIVSEDIVETELQRALATVQPNLNAQHGALLCAKYLAMRMLRIPRLKTGKNKVVNAIEADASRRERLAHTLTNIRGASNLHFRSPCPLIRAAYMDVVLVYLRSTQKSDPSLQNKTHYPDGLGIDVPMELNRSLTNPCMGPGEGLFRRTLAQIFAHDPALSQLCEYDPAAATILKLGKADPDACISFFREINDVALANANVFDDVLRVLLIASSSILGSEYHVELKCEVQRFLLDLTKSGLTITTNDTMVPLFLDACETATGYNTSESNCTYANQWVQLQAVKCERYASLARDLTEEESDAIVPLVSSCKLAVNQEPSSLFSGEAAALAMDHLNLSWNHLNRNRSSLFLDSCLCIYDLLNDDDEDIRKLAAKIACRILNVEKGSSKRSMVCEPISAQQNLIKFILGRWVNDPRFSEEAIARAFHIHISSASSSVGDRIAACSGTDTALFVEEKQNLYIDEARETRLWAQVIGALAPTAIPRRLLSRLTLWVSAGLDELRAAVTSGNGGTLGWSSTPDAFVIGLQVVYGTETLLRLSAKGTRMAVRPSELRKKLGLLALGASDRNMDPLWVAEIGRVMTWSVISRLALQDELLCEIVRKDW